MSKIVFSLVVVLMSAVPAWSDEGTSVGSTPLSGRIFTDFYVPTKNPLDSSLLQASASAWLEAQPKFGENSFGHFTFTLDEIGVSSSLGTSQLRTGLREGYVNYSKSGWEFQVGKMITPWGKSDAINPTDFLTGKDYSFFNPDEEVRRTGAISIQVSWTPNEGNSPFTLTWVETPIFAQSRLILAPGQVPSSVSLNTTPQTPGFSLSNSESAFKISYSGNQWDASLLAFRGWNHTPIFEASSVTGTLPNLSIGAIEVFQRYRALGADTSLTLGKWVLRGESAYVWTDNDNGQNPLIQPSHLDAVLGVERPIFGDFRAQTQFFVRYFPQFLSPSQIGGSSPASILVNQQIALTNALIQNYQDQLRPGGTLRLAYSSDENGINAELFILANFVGGDYLFRPQFAYSWTDSIKTTAGLDYRAGPVDRPLGALAFYNSVFLEARYIF